MNELIILDGELQHYGVVGMKWGVRKANYYAKRRSRLEKKVANYDLKAAKKARKASKLHEKDIDAVSRRSMRKAAKFEVKAKKMMKKSIKDLDGFERAKIERKASKYQAKASKHKLEANKLARSVSYNDKAGKYASKADMYTFKADKFRHKIQHDDRYRAALNKKISKLSEDDLNGRYDFVKNLIRD